MPITKSAKKALRQSIKKRKMNLQRKKALKDILIKIRKLKTEGKGAEAEKLISSAYKAIDKASKRGIIKRGTAARKKSRLVKFIRR